MKRLLLGLLLAAAASLSMPLAASAAEYTTFVGCDDLSANPVPSHVCQIGEFPGAYFESDVETEYEVCVEFPDTEFLCTEQPQLAEADVLYVNSITTGLEGDHLVIWYVEGVEVGSWVFRMDPPPPPPTLPPPPAPVTLIPPPAISTAPSPHCLAAQQHVAKLKGRLHKAHGAKQKSKIRAKLRIARAAARAAC